MSGGDEFKKILKELSLLSGAKMSLVFLNNSGALKGLFPVMPATIATDITLLKEHFYNKCM